MHQSKKNGPKKFRRATRGAPIKLTKEVQDAIVNAITMGCYVETAAAMAGIHKDTYYDWFKKGAKQSKGIYRTFSDAVSRALAMSEFRDLAVIDTAAHGKKASVDKDGKKIEAVAPNWQAAAWKLERKFPQKWGRHDRIELDDQKDAPQTITALIAELAEGLDDDQND